MARRAAWMLILLVVAACAMMGAAEITVGAVNETNEPMVIQVVEGMGPGAPPYGPAHTVGPGQERSVELAVPGGQWAVTVNGGELVGSLDAGARRGRLPVTLILSDAGPHWQSPADWAVTDE